MIILRTIFIVIFTALFINCSETPENSGFSKSDTATLESPGTVGKTPFSLGPPNATVQSLLTLKAVKFSLNSTKIKWYVNDVLDNTAQGISLSGNKLNKGDTVHAVITANDQKYTSNKITIRNTIPVMRRARLLPTVPKAVSTLSVDVDAGDSDRDTIIFKYKWYVNEKLISEENFIESEFKRGDTVSVEVTPFDSEIDGKNIRLTSKIFNSLPVFIESSPHFDGKTYTCLITAKDPDGDVLTYDLEQKPEGMTIDTSNGNIRWAINEEMKNRFSFRLSISDDHGGKIIVPVNAKIGIEED